LFIDNY